MMRQDQQTKGLFLAVCLLGLMMAGCDKIYGVLDKKGAEEKKLIGDTLPFEQDPEVQEIQRLLTIYGYSPGKADGKLGQKTREAIAKFQEDQGLDVSRTMDQATWEKLSLFIQYGLVINGEINIELVQRILRADGFDPGVPDGKLGPRTKRAIVDFQRAYNLKPDGKVGYKTLKKMTEFLVIE